MNKQNLGDRFVRLQKWLPSRGSMIFSLMLMGMLFWVQSTGAFAPVVQSATSLAVPQQIPWQGRLADASGGPLTGTYPMVFRLYDSAGAAAYPLWEENWIGPNSILVSDGLFNVMLGALNPISPTLMAQNQSLWLGVTVGTDDEMVPRVKLGSAPYTFIAQKALDAERLGGQTSTDIISQTLASMPDSTPTGVINAFGGVTAPDGWLVCDGRAVSRTEYPELFATLGTTWGAGDGVTTFNLPDLRGRFLRGVDSGAGRDDNAAERVACNTGGATGDNAGTCQDDMLQAHKHTDSGHAHSYTNHPEDQSVDSHGSHHAADDDGKGKTTGIGYANLGDPVTSTGGTVRYGMETRPENVAVVYIIKQ